MFLKPSTWRNFSASPIWSTRQITGCGALSTSLWVHMNLFWQLSRDGNLHGSGMSHATTASPKPSFRAPWWCRGRQTKCWMDNIEERTSLPRARTAHKGLLQERLDEDLCWMVLHVPPKIQSVTGLNWAEYVCESNLSNLERNENWKG